MDQSEFLKYLVKRDQDVNSQMDRDFWAGAQCLSIVKRRDMSINIVEYFNKNNDYYSHMFDRVSCGLTGKQFFLTC